MKRAIAALSLLLMPALASAQVGEPPAPGTSEATFELSWSRFDRFYDDDGTPRALDDAYGPGTRDVAIDALMFQFGGRYVFGPGFDAWVDVPLVRLTRTGETEGLLDDQSRYAEAMAMGDVGAGARLEVPLDAGGVRSAFGVGAALKAPTGNHEKIGSRELATGGGDYGLGGELFAVVRPGHAEIGGAAGLMLLLPQERDGVEIDRGDARGARLWVAFPLGPRARIGATLLALVREPDRVEGEPVEVLSGGAQPGALVPASRLLSIGPSVEVSPVRRSRLVVSLCGPTSPWLFVPGQAGWALSGKNVLVSGTQLRIAFRSEL